MKYSKSQLNAISRSYSLKAKKEREQQAKEAGVDVVFKYGTYKRLDALLRASDEKLKSEILEAYKKCEKRVNELIRCGCKSFTLDEAKADLAKLHNLLQFNGGIKC